MGHVALAGVCANLTRHGVPLHGRLYLYPIILMWVSLTQLAFAGPKWARYYVGPIQFMVCYGAVVACTLLGGQCLKVKFLSKPLFRVWAIVSMIPVQPKTF